MMPHFDFRPGVLGARFYRGETGLPEDEFLTEIKLSGPHDVFELGFEITLSGLEYLRYPTEWMSIVGEEKFDHDGYVPFHLNFVLYHQRGMRDNRIVSYHAMYIDEEILKERFMRTQFTVTKFRNDIKDFLDDSDDSFESDFVADMFHFVVFMTQDIPNEENIEDHIFNNPNILFKTKIPYVDEVGERNED